MYQDRPYFFVTSSIILKIRKLMHNRLLDALQLQSRLFSLFLYFRDRGKVHFFETRRFQHISWYSPVSFPNETMYRKIFWAYSGQSEYKRWFESMMFHG